MVNSRDNGDGGPSDRSLVPYDRILQKEKTLKASSSLGQLCAIVYVQGVQLDCDWFLVVWSP